jgi:hypothetical protein
LESFFIGRNPDLEDKDSCRLKEEVAVAGLVLKVWLEGLGSDPVSQVLLQLSLSDTFQDVRS